MIRLADILITEIKTGNIANIIGKIILKTLKQRTTNFNIQKIDQDVQGKFKPIFKNVIINVNQSKSQKLIVNGAFSTLDNAIIIKIDKNAADEFRSGNLITIDTLRRELITILEHEITHLIQLYKYPEARNKDLIQFKTNAKKFIKKYSIDYREIEAHANQLIKLAKDYKIDIEDAIAYYANVFNVNKKLLYKKLWKLGAFNKKFHDKYPQKKPTGGYGQGISVKK